MTVAEFIEWLKEQDQEATVECVVADSEGYSASVQHFTPALSYYTDFRNNKFLKAGSPLTGKRFLLIGED